MAATTMGDSHFRFKQQHQSPSLASSSDISSDSHLFSISPQVLSLSEGTGTTSPYNQPHLCRIVDIFHFSLCLLPIVLATAATTALRRRLNYNNDNGGSRQSSTMTKSIAFKTADSQEEVHLVNYILQSRTFPAA
ncbi:hypothetical protein EDB89DRAFT_2065791 [Lactarius sanguifluus]|nr:hypothetical protein EDB89DRAFT_2065791 [Lactarius sanguifluus]